MASPKSVLVFGFAAVATLSAALVSRYSQETHAPRPRKSVVTFVTGTCDSRHRSAQSGSVHRNRHCPTRTTIQQAHGAEAQGGRT